MTGSGGEEDDCGSVDTKDPESRVGCCDTVETGVAGPTRAASPQVFEMLYAGLKRPLTVEEVEGVEKTEALGAVRALRTEDLNQMENPEGTGIVELDTAFIAGAVVVARTISVFDTGIVKNTATRVW